MLINKNQGNYIIERSDFSKFFRKKICIDTIKEEIWLGDEIISSFKDIYSLVNKTNTFIGNKLVVINNNSKRTLYRGKRKEIDELIKVLNREIYHNRVSKEFDYKVIESIKGYSDSITGLNKTLAGHIDIYKYPIVTFSVEEERTKEIISRLSTDLDLENHQLFYSSLDYKNNIRKICILKSRDRYDILNGLGTNGVNINVETEDIIHKLKKWDNDYGVDILGADFDWVEVEFKNLPFDKVEGLANEIYEFCPDTIDQGVGSMEKLIKMLEVCSSVYLWWD